VVGGGVSATKVEIGVHKVEKSSAVKVETAGLVSSKTGKVAAQADVATALKPAGKTELKSSVLEKHQNPTKSDSWKNYVEFKDKKVYQRDDLIDPNKIHPDHGVTNLEAMKRGYAPVGPDGKPVNLHHMIQTEKGSIAEVTETFHKENTKIIHINPSTIESGINRGKFKVWRESYWIKRSKDFY
jgi:filamentous hemagglutinin